MLRDIESRQEQPPAAAPRPVPVKPIYHDLRPAVHVPGRSRRAGLLMIAGIGVVVLVTSVYYIAPHVSLPGMPRGGQEQASAHRVPTASTELPAAKSAVAVAPTVVPTPASQLETIVVPQSMAAPSPTTEQPAIERASSPAATPVQGVVAAPVVTKAPSSPATSVKPPMQKSSVVADKPKAGSDAVARIEAGAIDKRMRPLTVEEKAEGAYRQAVRSLEQGRSGDAGRQLQQALSVDPQHVHARELQVALALKNGRTREAQQLLEEGIRLAPKHYPFVQLLARIYVEQGAEPRALALLEQTAPMATGDADYMSLLAALYQRQSRHADAVAAYRRAVEIRPDDARAWVGLGISLEMEKDPDAARASYQRARDLGNLPLALSRHASQRLAQLNSTN